MLRTQEIEIKEKIPLSDLKLEKDNEIEIFADTNSEVDATKLIKIVNVSGKIVIFVQGLEDIVLKEWEGARLYKEVIKETMDSLFKDEDIR